MAGVVTTAASGTPLPMPLAMVTMSGTTPSVLEAPVVLAGAAEAGLDLVGDAEPAVLADDVVDDLEIAGGISTTPPTPCIGSAMKPATLPGVVVADQVLHVGRALRRQPRPAFAPVRASGNGSGQSAWCTADPGCC